MLEVSGGNKKICPDFSIVNSFVKQRLMVTFPCHLVAKLGISIIRRNILPFQTTTSVISYFREQCLTVCQPDLMRDCYKCCKNNFSLCLFLRPNKTDESNNSSQNKPSSVKFSTKIFLSEPEKIFSFIQTN